MNQEKNRTGFEITVIGMSGRFPGARNIDEYWENLKNGIESISFFSTEELKEADNDPGLLENSNYIRAKGLLEDSQYFDAAFFNYTPKEAVLMDPQTRILHECAWEALENAGYNPESYNGSTGFFAGASFNSDWIKFSSASVISREMGRWASEQYIDSNYSCMRVAYRLNLRGPSFGMYTACSTSLVAIHLACQSLLNGECEMALAGGVSATVPPRSGHLFQEGMTMSPDGHCRAFDAKGAGIVLGSGVGIVVLKRLEDAIADNDHPYAVLLGSAVNNDGNRKSGFAALSVEGQVEVIRTAQQMAHVEPESISYIESHGTGTAIGDPIEADALRIAFNTDKKHFCGLGTVKTNIGHLDAAAGVASFIKTVLVLKHRLCPASLHFETPNPNIDFANSPFYVNTRLKEWKNDKYPLRAGVSCFGVGGTNAHVILEEWTEDRRSDGQSTDGRPQLILLSARTQAALDVMAQNLADHLKKNPLVNLADVAYTLQVGRKRFPYRRMAICSSIRQTIETLSAAAAPTHVQDEQTSMAGDINIEVLKEMQAKAVDEKELLEKIGTLWLQGAALDWTGFYAQQKRCRVPLPTYPFQRQHYRIKNALSQLEIDLAARPELRTAYAAPETKIQHVLAAIWQELLGIRDIGIHDDFFELGGDSLKAISVTGKIHKEFNTQVTLTEFFKHPTIEKFAQYIADTGQMADSEQTIFPGTGNVKYESIPLIEEREYYNLTPSQRRIWIVEQLNEGDEIYDIPHLFQINGRLSLESFQKAIELVVQRHENLRTVFLKIKGEPKQKIYKRIKVPFYYLDFRELENKEERINQEVENIVNRKFSLEKGPLFEAALIREREDKFTFVFNIHHIIFDRVSSKVLLKELFRFYSAFCKGETNPLEELIIQYKDYAAWLSQVLGGDSLKRLEEYWLGNFRGPVPVLELPADRPRPVDKDMQVEKLTFFTDEAITAKLDGLCKRYTLTLFMVQLAFLYVLMIKYTGQTDIAFTSFISGRNHKDLEPLIGYFVNLLVLRILMNPDDSFADVVRKVKKVTLEAYEHQLYPFEDFVEKLHITRERDRVALSKIRIDAKDFVPEMDFDVEELKVKSLMDQLSYPEIYKEDLYFCFTRYEKRIKVEIEYYPDMFDRSRIELMRDRYIDLMEKLLENENTRILDIDFTAAAEKELGGDLDVEFNI